MIASSCVVFAANSLSPGNWLDQSWRGYASPKDFNGEFSDKPGLMHIAAGAEEDLSYRIEVGSS